MFSNGNLTEQGDLKDGRHYVVWEDSFKKPCYLFSLIASTLVSRDVIVITRSRHQVSLPIWTHVDDISKIVYVMYTIKVAMKWDEDVFGLDYDFNLGVIENKNLNIFNTRLVLTSPQTTMDTN